MAVAGYFLMAPSAMLLVLTGIVSAKAQREPSSDRDLVLFCGSIVGLMLEFIMIALADEISNSQFWATSSGLIRAPGERLESALLGHPSAPATWSSPRPSRAPAAP